MSVSDNRQAILEVLDQLPPLHEVAQKLITLMKDENASAQDLDRLIRNDQALTARILKLANSSTYGKSREIFRLAEAVVLVGHSTLTNLVLGVSVADNIAGKMDSEFANQAWAHSLDCAALAQTLAEITGLASPEQAFVAGLLHDIGLLVQAQATPEVLREVLAANPADPMNAERGAMGLNHAQVGLKLLDKWSLPPALCEAVRFHHSPKPKYLRTNPLVNIVALADRLTQVIGTSPYPNQQSADHFRQLRLLGIEADQFENLFKVLAHSRHKARGLLTEVDAAKASAGPTVAQDELSPIGIYAADDRRRIWYAAALDFLGLPVAQTPDSISPTTVLLDFHGASPEERAQVDQTVRSEGLLPLVVGDRRHTPPGDFWQGAPHLPELFTRDQVLAGLASAETARSAQPTA